MVTGNDKYELYENVKKLLEEKGLRVSDSSEINYGLQFKVNHQNKEGLIRIYQSKKGTRLDLSQVKETSLLDSLNTYLSIEEKPINNKKNSLSKNKNDVTLESFNKLIGTDESGKGDYFGPLVVSGVYVDSKTSSILREIGVMDSKKLSDNQIKKLAVQIKKICEYSIVVIGNEKYNELYNKIGNLNKLLAWGHARAIENLLEKVECEQALSDQFGDEGLIKNALLKNGKSIKLYQRTKAEEYIAVAAASILARSEYVSRLENLSMKFKLEFPKGASSKSVEIANTYVSNFGKQELHRVAKLHFKTTEQIKA